MRRQWVRIGIVLFLVGGCIGLLARQSVRATPANGSKDWPKSVFYVEKWKAAEGYVNTPNGYHILRDQDNDFDQNTTVSGEIDEDSGIPYVKTSPDLFVTQWRVNGHIHFK